MDSREKILEYLEDCPDDIKQYIDVVLRELEGTIDNIILDTDVINCDMTPESLDRQVELIRDKLHVLSDKLYW